MNLGGGRPAGAEIGSSSTGQELPPEDGGFVRWLFRMGDLDAGQYRPETLGRRLPACLRAIHAADVREARRMLERNPSLVPAAPSAIVIGVSSFFRDEGVFDYLTYHVLPGLPCHSRRARIWSAACSEGQEPYSVAMLLSELGRLDRTDLLATDCRRDAVARAKEGVYDEHLMRGVPASWLMKYFSSEQNHWRVSEALRNAVEFRAADLLQICEPGGWDLILCRNAGMYLRPEDAGPLWQRLEEALHPGGYLVLGKAERPVGATRLSRRDTVCLPA